MRIQPKEGMSVSLQKFHRQSMMQQMASSVDKQEQQPLPELRVRGLKSAGLRQSPKRNSNPIKFYINELQSVAYDDQAKVDQNVIDQRRGENISEYVFVDTYLEALNYVSQEGKIKKLHSNGATLASDSFAELLQNSSPPLPNLQNQINQPAQQIRERMRRYAEGKQKEVVKIYMQREPKRNAKTSVSLISQKAIQEYNRASLHTSIPPQKCKVSAKRWCIFVKQPNEKIFKRAYGWQDYQKCEVASITKIMTCYTTLHFLKDNRLTPEQIRIKIPGHAECIDGTSAFLNAGGILTVQQLMHALMLPSGNDAALVLSFSIAALMLQQKNDPFQYSRHVKGLPIDCEYEIERNKKLLKHTFLDKMNEHREKLQMDSTYYHSVHGLNDQKNVSCAANIATLIEQSIQLQEFRDVITTRVYKTHALNDKGGKSTFYKWKNTNKLLKKEGWAGVKTGVTSNAGPCYSGYFKSDQLEAIIVVLNCSNMNQRFRDAEILLQSVKP